MTTTNETTRVRLTGRRGLLAAIPAMLGFHPQESLVMVCLSGSRRRVGPVIRVDLTDPRDSDAGAAPVSPLLLHARRHADEVALVCYTEASDRPVMFGELIAGLASNGVGVLDAVLVRGGRVYSGPAGTRSATIGVAAQRGMPVPDDDDYQVTALAAASALQGRGVLANRQALHDSIAGPTGADARKVSAALHAAAEGLLGTVGQEGPIDPDRLMRLAEVNVERALVDVAGSNGIAPSTSALLAILLCHIEIRDRLIALAVNDLVSPWLPVLITVAAATPDTYAAEVCAVLAVAAYRRGDGALAQVAVDRCLAAEPDHRLAHLMLGVMDAGLHPDELAYLARDGGMGKSGQDTAGTGAGSSPGAGG